MLYSALLAWSVYIFLQREGLSIFSSLLGLLQDMTTLFYSSLFLDSQIISIFEPETKWDGISLIIYLVLKAVCRLSCFLNTCQPSSHVKENFLWLVLCLVNILKNKRLEIFTYFLRLY